MVGVETAPGGNGTRDGDRMRACLGNLAVYAELCKGCNGGGGRRAARTVERLDRTARRCVERKAIATDTGHQGIDDALNGDSRNRCVDSIAAILQDFQTGCGGERMRRGNHRAGRQGRRAPCGKEIEIRHVIPLFH
jgi:hypothetical protein